MEDKRKEIVGNVIRIQRYHSPCGDLMLGSFEDRLCLCDWAVESHRDIVDRRLRKVLKACYEESTSEVIQKAIKQLDEYFNGERTAFEVPLLFVGTDFQKSVWYKLLDIPYGSTVSYGELAKQLDMPKAVRAVAAANGANAISIFAPCHRVIGSNHTLVGYGGGLPAKKTVTGFGNKRQTSVMNEQETLDYARIAQAIGYIRENFKRQPGLDEIAREVALSTAHFQRMFTEWAGVSPKKFLQYTSIEYAKKIWMRLMRLCLIRHRKRGLSGTGRLYDLFVNIEGMTPGE